MKLRVLVPSTIVFLILYVLAYLVQVRAIGGLQRSVFDDSISFTVLQLLHGVRVIAAWIFGWWSILMLLPCVGFIYLTLHMAGLPITTERYVVSAVHIVSAPVCFAILRIVLPEDDRRSTREWRVVMLAGTLSAVFNALALGFYFTPDVTTRQAFVWLAGLIVAQIAGLFVVLLAFRLGLRIIAAPSRG